MAPVTNCGLQALKIAPTYYQKAHQGAAVNQRAYNAKINPDI